MSSNNEKDECEEYWKSKSLKRKIIEKMRHFYFAKIFTKIVRKYQDNGRILEAGCGSGVYLGRLKKNRKITPVGIDYSKSSIKVAKRNCDNLVLGDIRYLPFKNNSFDMVFNQGVMEHFSEMEFKDILKELKRVSKKILIIVPSKTSIFKFRILCPFDATQKFYNKKELEKLVKKEFSNVESAYMPTSFFLSVYCYGSNEMPENGGYIKK